MPLTSQGFDRVVGKLKMTSRDNRHRFLWLEHEGRKILWTERSHGRGEVGRVEFAIRRQLRVNSDQMKRLADCSLTRDAYIEHLRNIGVIERQ